jgi:16S rRNA (cytosine1402-N4)-methyltransferase
VSADFHHVPVLLEASAEYLHLKPGAIILDGTLGGGGHAEAILERIGPDGILVGLDLDQQALMASTSRLARFGDRIRTVQSSFRHLNTALDKLGIEGVDGVLLDLGVSSYQLDAPDRGFRFGDAAASSTPLDMRMDASQGVSAADLLQRASAEELQGWFQRYGELPGSRRLAKAITQRRVRQPLRTTADLLQVIEEAGVGGGRRHNPATLVFQALRIAVNDELGALEDGLGAAVSILRPGGRLVVISYHSLEDRIVKHSFRSAARGCICPPKQPICNCGRSPSLEVLTRRPLRPDTPETERNPRARSARLRAAKRIAEAA